MCIYGSVYCELVYVLVCIQVFVSDFGCVNVSECMCIIVGDCECKFSGCEVVNVWVCGSVCL